MNVSQLISKLVSIYQEHGNLEVERYNTCCCYGDWSETITNIEANGIVIIT